MAMKQNLMPNFSRWVALTLALIAMAVGGMLEQRTRFVLSDGTVVTGKVESEDEATVEVERASGYVQRIEKSRIRERSFWNVEFDLNLGLDLRGGTTLRYRVDLEEYPLDERPEILDRTVETFRKRLDTLGVKEISIVSAPPDQINIELPGVTMEESLAYEQIIQRLGTLRFLIVAGSEAVDNLNRATEEQRVRDYLKELEAKGGWNPKSVDLTRFDVKGASGKTYRWFRWSDREIEGRPDLAAFPFELLEIEAKYDFSGEDLKRTYVSSDSSGRPAVGFMLNDAKGEQFGEFTERYLHRAMAIVLDDVIHSTPTLNGVITNSGIIEGGARGFSQLELKEYVTVFNSGSLRVTPELLSKATIGPSLGEASIDRGIWAGAISSIIVVAFIIWFYGLVGVLSSITLLAGVFLMIGGLGFLEATLTLPGIAGIVLTIGMAIDQNILVNERVREERQKGKTVPQAIKNGFERAFITIFDAQATTFLTAAILYYYGTGPIKGFAVTLMLGIVTTMYAAIVGQKILFAIGLERGWFGELKLRHLFANINIPYTRYFKACVTGSVIVCGASLIGFLTFYEDLKGLDFAGGFQTRIRLVESAPQREVEAKLHEVYPGAQVVSLRSVGVGGVTESGKSSEFLVKIRTDTGDAGEAGGKREQYIGSIAAAFAGRLVPQGIAQVQIAPDVDAGKSTAKFRLNFDRPVAPSTIDARLRQNLSITALAPTGDQAVENYDVEVAYPSIVVEDKLRADVTAALAELPGGVRLSDPFPESAFISPKVGKELRDSAIIAMFFSLIGLLIYVRVRFADFNWGFAACVALAHDVAFSLGAMTLFHMLGIVDCEIDLTTIGALLTLVGFSLNDTIVIFDRVRENLARSPEKSLKEIVDVSVNQTMSRTILTSSTVFFAVLVLFAANYGQRNVLEGFSFVMIAGIVTGTYSTIYIASPMLVWLTARDRAKKQKPGAPAASPQPTSAA